MFEKIKEELKKKGLPENYAAYLMTKVDSEDKIEGEVDELNKKIEKINSKEMSPQDLMKEVASGLGFEDHLNLSLQKEGDRRATEAINTYKKKNEGGSNQNQNAGGSNNQNAGGSNNQNAGGSQTQGNEGEKTAQEKLLERIDQLEQKLNEKSKTDEKESKKDKAKKLFKQKELSEDLASFVDPDSEEDIETQVENISKKFDDHAQKVIDKKVEENEYVPSQGRSQSSEKTIENAASEIVEEKKSEE